MLIFAENNELNLEFFTASSLISILGQGNALKFEKWNDVFA